MKLVVFGASGATGRQVVAQGLDRGMVVTAFVRDPRKLDIAHPALSIVKGNVADQSAITRAIAGQGCVVSTLGVGKPLRHDQVVIDGIRHIIQAMTYAGVERFIYMSFIGVRESRDAAGFMVRYIARWPLRNEIHDHEIKEGLVRSSKLLWTIVRPPTLGNGPRTGAYRVGTDIAARSLLPTLSRADVADCIVNEAEAGAFVHNVLRVQPQ